MSYTKKNWQDHVVPNPGQYTAVDNGDGTWTLTEDFGTPVQEGTPLSSTNMNNIETGIEQNNLFNLLLTPGRYKVTEFDTPTAGDITETIKLTADDSTIATLVTEFDTPTSGDITTTLTCVSLGLSSKVVVEFDTPTAGDIKESAEVV